MIVAAVGLLAASYELAALASRGKLPTITAGMRRLPRPWRLAIVAVFAALLADHFTSGYVP